MKKQFGILAAAVVALSASAQANALSAGDLAVIAYNTDGDDNFAWVALADIAAGTTINFTDSSWQGTAFRSTEHLDAGGPLTWTSAGALTAGTVVSYSGKTANVWSVGTSGGIGLDLSASGDQIFAFLGDKNAPSFVYGLGFANASGWILPPTVSNATTTSNVPAGLGIGSTATFTDGLDNGYYSGTKTGTRTELLSAIANPANWTTNNTELASTAWATGFTVAAVPEPETYAMFLAGLGLIGAIARRRKA